MFFGLIVGLFALLGCNTLVKNLQEPKKITEMPEQTDVETPFFYDFIAKNFYIKKEYDRAIYYYDLLIEKFSDEKYQGAYEKEITWAEYEKAYCYYKMKRYNTAKDLFSAILNDRSDFVARKLSNMMLNRMGQKGENDL